MSGGSKEQTVGYRYHMGLHFGICKGPVDSLTAIEAGERRAWIGGQTVNGTIAIDQPTLFGGDEREGGIQGGLEVMMGEATQGANAYLTAKQGARQPGYRGLLSAVWNGGMVSANNPYIKPWAFRVRRILKGWKSAAGTTAWYPEKAEILLIAQQESVVLTEFYSDLDGWALITGANLYSISSGPFGYQLDVASQNVPAGQVSVLRRPFPRSNVTKWEFTFTVTASNSDDGPLILLMDAALSTATGILFNPMREAAFDASRRPNLWVNGSQVLMGSTGVTIGVAYVFTLVISPTTGAWSATIKRRDNSVVHSTTSGTNAAAGEDLEFVQVQVDASGPTCPANFADLKVYTSIAGIGMNPAHIVYECLTNLDWGMGYGTSLINDTNFRAAADTFFAESMGLCLYWAQQQPIQQFVQVVLDHCGAVLTQDPTTGLFILTPLRGGYDPSLLPVFDASNIIEVESYEKPALPEAVNEVTVKYRDLALHKEVPVKVQNLALITAAGGVVARTTSYPGFAIASLASRAAMRDLIAASSPLARVRLKVDRSAYTRVPGGLLRFTWPKLGVTLMVLRALKVDLGTLADGRIGLECVEDVFSLPSSTYAKEQGSGFTSPNTSPAAATNRIVREAHYFEVLRELGTSDTAALANDAGFVVGAAVRPSNDSIDFGLFARVGAADFKELGRGAFCPSGTISAVLDPGATSATITNLVDSTLVQIGTYAQIGTEIVRVDAWNSSTGAIALGRGVLGTPAQRHAALTRVYFIDGFLAHDVTERVDAEVVDVRLTPRTGVGQLVLSAAPNNRVVLDQLAFRPYLPGQLRINGTLFPASAAGSMAVTWKHRNRLQQNLEGDESGNIGPEASTVYNVWLRQDSDGTVIDSDTGLTGTEWLVGTLPSTPGNYRLELQSEIAGLVSAQMHRFVFAWVDPFRVTASLLTAGASGGSGGTSVAPGRVLAASAALIAGAAYVAA